MATKDGKHKLDLCPECTGLKQARFKRCGDCKINNKFIGTHSEYKKLRYQSLMQEARESLGGQCVICETTLDLQFDHIDPKTKLFNISDGWTKKRSLWWTEVSKCQLLCDLHHKEKTYGTTSQS